MTDEPFDAVTPCVGSVTRCGSFLPGHNTHTVRSTLAGQAPADWTRCTVEEIHGLVVTLNVHGDTSLTLAWHHQPLDEHLAPGDQIRLHRSYGLIEVGSTWLSVVRSTLG